MARPCGPVTFTVAPGAASPRSTRSLEKIQGWPEATRSAAFRFTLISINESPAVTAVYSGLAEAKPGGPPPAIHHRSPKPLFIGDPEQKSLDAALIT